MVFLCYAILSFALSPLALAAPQFRSLRSLALPDLNHAGVATATRKIAVFKFRVCLDSVKYTHQLWKKGLIGLMLTDLLELQEIARTFKKQLLSPLFSPDLKHARVACQKPVR